MGSAIDNLREFDRRGKQDEAGRDELQALIDAAKSNCGPADLWLIDQEERRVARMKARWDHPDDHCSREFQPRSYGSLKALVEASSSMAQPNLTKEVIKILQSRDETVRATDVRNYLARGSRVHASSRY